MQTVKVFAPATIGNIGPGFDVLGLAIRGIGDTVEARRIRTPGVTMKCVTSDRPGMNLPLDPRRNTAGMAALETLKVLGVKGGVELSLHKGLPTGSGLGSSAASAVAGAFAVNELYGRKLSKEELILPATAAEARVSGGFFADNTAPCLLGGATLTRSCVPLDVTRIGSIDHLIIVVVTPDLVVLTREARAILPKEIPFKNFVFNMANTSLITAAFAKNDYSLFARSLHDHIVEPVRARLIKGFPAVKRAALQAGADGMSISGSGPTVFAITSNPTRARRIRNAMVSAFKAAGVAAEAWITEADPEGARVIG